MTFDFVSGVAAAPLGDSTVRVDAPLKSRHVLGGVAPAAPRS